MDEKSALGEVIASDSQMLEVECHTLYGAPRFGSFVRADCLGSGIHHFGVVTHVSTAPVDGNRIVQAHKLQPGELEQRKPHLPTLFRTTFQVRVVGYGDKNAIVTSTPRTPARIHCWVYDAADHQIQALTKSPDFLRPLAQMADVPLEDLLVAAIESAQHAWAGAAPLISWAKYLARLLHHDYVTLESVIQRLSPASIPPTARTPVPAAQHPRYEKSLSTLTTAGAGDPFED